MEVALVCYLLWTFIEHVTTEGSDQPCLNLGGVCRNTYEGCHGKDGKFTRGKCSGPIYFQCCLRTKPIEDVPEPTPAPWRMCHKCRHTLVDGNHRGDEGCLDPFSPTAQNMHSTNCSGQCSKEWLRLDDNNYSLVRGCSLDYHPTRMSDYHQIHCCYDNLCNAAYSLNADVIQMCTTMLMTVCIIFVNVKMS